MKLLFTWCAVSAFIALSSIAGPARADFHFWDIKEIYSNASGSVQFIEFYTDFAGQHVLGGHNLVATSTVGGTPTVKTFTFSGNLSLLPPNPNSTAGQHMLIATAGFGGHAGGVTPDYTLTFTPPGGSFFNPNADLISLNFAHGTDIVTFAGSALPKNGVNSLSETVPSSPAQNFVSGVNSPTNFPGAVGSVNLPPPSIPGDFTGNGVVDGADLGVWRNNFGLTGAPTTMQGNADGDSDVDGADFLVWQRQLNAAAAVAVPEPASAAASLVAFVLLIAGWRR